MPRVKKARLVLTLPQHFDNIIASISGDSEDRLNAPTHNGVHQNIGSSYAQGRR